MVEKTPIITINNVKKKFKENRVLRGINFKIYPNEIIGLLGKSGCGKSTFLKILIGFYKSDSGKIIFDKDKIEVENIKNIYGYVSQENAFYEKLTVVENLRFFARLYKINSDVIDERIKHLLELVKLTKAKNTLAERISGGMKRRLEFAISLIHDPSILILDEPFTGLDVEIKNQLWDVVKEIKDSGVTVIISSHLLKSLYENSDRIVIVKEGQIVDDFYIDEKSKIDENFDIEKYFLEAVN